MPREDLQIYELNLSLKKVFKELNLELEPIFYFTPLDLDSENRRLEHLLDFVKRYQQYGSQEVMKKVEGEFIYPPIYPGISPWSDWTCFERWIQGKPVREPLLNQFSLHEKFRPAADIPDSEIEAETDRLISYIRKTGNGISLNDGIPIRLVYSNLMEWIKEPHEFGGGWTFDGCSGYCPGCFQRPWCETGNSSCWPEDEEIQKIHYTEELKKFVSSSPQSYSIISKLQAAEDEEREKWKLENEEKKDKPFLDYEGLRDYNDDDDLPF